MSSSGEGAAELIWATRGRSWGFRFLWTGGLPDPLPEYERIFDGLGDEPSGWQRVGAKVAVRFPDPSGRRDAAGRVIPHEFVVSGSLADDIQSVEDGRRSIWPKVASIYDRVWDADQAPLAEDLAPEPPADDGR